MRVPPKKLWLGTAGSCSRRREIAGSVSSARGFYLVEGHSLAMGRMLPSTYACSSGAELLWGWRAAVPVDDPEEADPVFPPTKNTQPVHPGVTGKAGCSLEGGDGAAAC